jgi:hypothetical protein
MMNDEQEFWILDSGFWLGRPGRFFLTDGFFGLRFTVSCSHPEADGSKLTHLRETRSSKLLSGWLLTASLRMTCSIHCSRFTVQVIT